jgi:hypothetical protein
MQFKRCSNANCRRPFQINEFNSKVSQTAAPKDLICPHCGHKEAVFGNSVFLVHALSPDEEKVFNAKNPH